MLCINKRLYRADGTYRRRRRGRAYGADRPDRQYSAKPL